MKKFPATTSEAAWRTWQDRCAAALCPPAVAAELRDFGRRRFLGYLNRYTRSSGGVADGRRLADIPDAWHLLESHAQLGKTRSGKRYKDWLFARAEGAGEEAPAFLESGASLLIRDATRRYLRHEHAASFMVSLQQPERRDGEAGHTLEDLLPDRVDVADEVAWREREELARREVANLLPGLSRRQCLVLWARRRGMSLDDRRLARWTKATKSIHYKDVHAVLESLQHAAGSLFRKDGTTVQYFFARLCLSTLQDLLEEKIVLEKFTPRFLG